MGTDKAKVIKGLKSCAVYFDCTKCPYFKLHDGYDTCVRHLMLDTLSVLAVNVEGESNQDEKRLLREVNK